MKTTIRIAGFTLGMLTVSTQAFVGMHDVTNFFRPTDSAIKLPPCEDTAFSLGSRFEYGSSSKSRSFCDERKVNVLQMYDPTQSTLDMLEKPTPCVDAKLVADLGGDIDAFLQIIQRDGIRGHQCVNGKFSGWDLTFFGNYTFMFDSVPGSFSLSGHLPIVQNKIDRLIIKDLTNTDRTQSTAVLDYMVKDLVTDNLASNVKKWGCLDLSCWEKTGLGDLVVMFAWNGIFPQKKDNLKEVELGAKIGLSFPTAEKKDENKAFSMPLGNDGAWGMPIGLNLGLNFIHHVRAGLDTDFKVLFNKTRVRRLKTTPNQTEFLLLNKGKVLKEFGLTWQFHLYLQAYHFIKGLSASAAYQYVKHDSDRLTPKCNDFDYSIINTANNLREWQAHNLLFKINYDCFTCFKSIKPQLEFFYKLPVAGKGIIDCDTFGGQLSFNF